MEIERRRNQINELRNHYDLNYKAFAEVLTQKKTSLKGTFSTNDQVIFLIYSEDLISP